MKKYIILLLITALGAACKPTRRSEEAKKKEQAYEESIERYSDGSCRDCRGSIVVVKVRECDYVMWHNGYGSDMEHHANCTNPNHKTNGGQK